MTDNTIIFLAFMVVILAIFAVGSIWCEIIERREIAKHKSKFFNYFV